jgi:hypothetical protein
LQTEIRRGQYSQAPPFKLKQDKEKLDFISKSYTLIVGNVSECKQQILNIKHETTSKIRQQLGR